MSRIINALIWNIVLSLICLETLTSMHVFPATANDCLLQTNSFGLVNRHIFRPIGRNFQPLMPSRYFYFQMCWCAEFMLRQYISWSPHININWCNDEKPNQTMSSPRFCSAIQNYITRTSMTFWLIAPVQLDFSIDAEKVWNSHLPMAMSILSWNDLSTNTCPVRILMRLY